MIGHNKTEKIISSELQSAFGKRVVQLSGWILWVFALLLIVALISYNPADPSFNTSSTQSPTNLLGYIGAHLSDMLIQWVGIASFFPVIVFMAWGWRIIKHQHLHGFILRIIAMLFALPVCAAVIAAIPLFVSNNYSPEWPSESGIGGSVGFVIAQTSFTAASDALGLSGKILIWSLGLILCALLIPLSMGLSKQEWQKIIRFFKRIFSIITYLIFKRKKTTTEADQYTNSAYSAPVRSYDKTPFKSDPNTVFEQDYTPPSYQESIRATTHTPYSAPAPKKQVASEMAPDNTPIFNPQDVQEKNTKHAPYSSAPAQITSAAPTSPSIETNKEVYQEENTVYEETETAAPPKVKDIFSLFNKPIKERLTPIKEHIVNEHIAPIKETLQAADPYKQQDPYTNENSWSFPPVSLLRENPAGNNNRPSEQILQANARMLETILDDYGVKGTIGEILCGPVVTLYELEPAPGIRSARVIGLSDDIARSLSVISVRIATVPGRNIIGIEVPNSTREMVYFSEMLTTEAWRRHTAKLCLALGKNIFGEPIYTNLAKMPHLLIAGTTGSGKSVGVNSMILSLLYRLSPDECRLILIDPKMLELSVYEGIPHLLTPVVTDPHKALSALKWAVREMERRYRLMSQLGVRNIDGYNQRITNARNQSKVMTRRVQTGFDTETGRPTFEEQQIPLEHFPYIVVVIDEMADLMMVAGKDIEAAVQRLAQMARAAGIHVIMATQRPSVDVITGTIKANFPTRISFQVISKFDSRTILGEQGSEQLLGQGDMLFMQAGGRIQRVHGPFVSDDEVDKVVHHLRQQGEPIYVEDVTAEPVEENNNTGRSGGNNNDDELYNQAITLVVKEGKASTSFIQRHLSIGYNRAAKIIEQMEKERIVSPANHVGKREILINKLPNE
ncbi:DNA segregation ATPase FtsK/SpoIIIE or related protein (FtsK) (PDB:2IUT) [Commensalibacter communis]|uniref:DNA translocase FtsK n=1 Tax=Commensalibacter communis TaxID=2972786 RepID=UPI0022FF6036|nr:DNA translocase FtsK [Commensalibacter communis]CAI3941757.1 DNA segregation ATPase FtsK/SpoIIIE or related protein (FtsK) (PDB:2IUT) [Commensalibacter communis]CAI3943059.1 DNA segregation ATPase FtsK/SpoIIIE or related protein (FtsK) (PDB:2IUT) [Commensalibacter communis]